MQKLIKQQTIPVGSIVKVIHHREKGTTQIYLKEQPKVNTTTTNHLFKQKTNSGRPTNGAVATKVTQQKSQTPPFFFIF